MCGDHSTTSTLLCWSPQYIGCVTQKATTPQPQTRRALLQNGRAMRLDNASGLVYLYGCLLLVRVSDYAYLYGCRLLPEGAKHAASGIWRIMVLETGSARKRRMASRGFIASSTVSVSSFRFYLRRGAETECRDVGLCCEPSIDFGISDQLPPPVT